VGIVDQLIAAKASLFLGTPTSLFSQTIAEEREGGRRVGRREEATTQMLGEGQAWPAQSKQEL